MRSLPFIYILFAFIGCQISKNAPSTIMKGREISNDYLIIYTRTRAKHIFCYTSYIATSLLLTQMLKTKTPPRSRRTEVESSVEYLVNYNVSAATFEVLLRSSSFSIATGYRLMGTCAIFELLKNWL